MTPMIQRVQDAIRRILNWLTRRADESNTDSNLPAAPADRLTPPAHWQQQTRQTPPAHWLKLVDELPGQQMTYQPGQPVQAPPVAPDTPDSASQRPPLMSPGQQVSQPPVPLRPVHPARTQPQSPQAVQPDRPSASPVHPVRPAPGKRAVIHPLRPVRDTRRKQPTISSHTPENPGKRIRYARPAVDTDGDSPSAVTETTPAYSDTSSVTSTDITPGQVASVRQIHPSENRSVTRAPRTQHPHAEPADMPDYQTASPAERDPLAMYHAQMQQRASQPPRSTQPAPDAPPSVPRIRPSRAAHHRPRTIKPDTHPAEFRPPQTPAYTAPHDPSVTRSSAADTPRHRPETHPAQHTRPRPVSEVRRAQMQSADVLRTRQAHHPRTDPPAVRETSQHPAAPPPVQAGRWPTLINEDDSSVVHRIQADDTASDDAHPYDIQPTHKRDTSWNV